MLSLRRNNRTSRMPNSVLRYLLDKAQYLLKLETVQRPIILVIPSSPIVKVHSFALLNGMVPPSLTWQFYPLTHPPIITTIITLKRSPKGTTSFSIVKLSIVTFFHSSKCAMTLEAQTLEVLTWRPRTVETSNDGIAGNGSFKWFLMLLHGV